MLVPLYAALSVYVELTFSNILHVVVSAPATGEAGAVSKGGDTPPCSHAALLPAAEEETSLGEDPSLGVPEAENPI